MTNKLDKHTQERQKLLRKLQTMQERLKGIDDKIFEEENLAIRSVMKSEKLTLSELMVLMRTSKQEQSQVQVQEDEKTQKTAQEPSTEGGF